MKSMLRFFMLAVAMALMFVSCSPEKKLEKMIKKHPTLFEQQTVDVILKETITETDTIFIEAVQDSATFRSNPAKNDALVLDNDNFTTRVEIVPTRNESGLLMNEVKVHTIVKERQILVRDTIYINKIVKGKAITPKPIVRYKIPKWIWWILALFVGLITTFILMYVKGKLPKYGLGLLLLFFVPMYQGCNSANAQSYSNYEKTLSTQECEATIAELRAEIRSKPSKKWTYLL